jgi:hypothetical protein
MTIHYLNPIQESSEIPKQPAEEEAARPRQTAGGFALNRAIPSDSAIRLRSIRIMGSIVSQKLRAKSIKTGRSSYGN